MLNQEHKYINMKTIIKLMDVKTLVAGITPVLFGSIYAEYAFKKFNLTYMLLIVVGIIFTQSATNMINDYFDYKRGADSGARGEEKALVSGEISPKQIIMIILVFELLAFCIGMFIGSRTSYYIMVIAAIGVFISVAYASGPLPISYLPIGELVSGMTMGIGITSTVLYIQSGVVNLRTIVIAIPTMIYIGTVLLSNNMSDRKEDREAGRKTLAIMIGAQRSEMLWIMNIMLIHILTLFFIFMGYYPIIMAPVMIILFPYKSIKEFLKYNKNVNTKGKTMGLIGSIGIRYHVSVIFVLLICIFFVQK